MHSTKNVNKLHFVFLIGSLVVELIDFFSLLYFVELFFRKKKSFCNTKVVVISKGFNLLGLKKN